ncbi:WbuC family cupin fold metalloprotein [Ferriphaselus sp. R-1]|uniref:WbuC family cupin fold metalloprotein n=1 Tax=Ferriphaselus sp. R-1 TaxID=1485544 RepID=UPI00054E948A|nr:WbuC family cupin fold metalloprotein [Ferriphaselus sp. R-1]
MKRLDHAALDQLAQQAQHSPRLRANHNLHEQLSDPVQRLAIAMEPDTLVLPHRHPHTWEVLFALRGRFVVLVFDAEGQTVVERTVLGEDTSVVELPAGAWHAVMSLDSGGVIFEVKQGGYVPVPASDTAAWSAGLDAATLNTWYASAEVGATYS